MAKGEGMTKAEWAKKNAKLLKSQGRRYNPKTDEFEIIEDGYVSKEGIKAGKQAVAQRRKANKK